MSSQKPSLVLALVVSLALAVGIGLGLVIDSAPDADANPVVAGAIALGLGLSDPDDADAWMPFDCWDGKDFSAIKRGVVEKCDYDQPFDITLSGGVLVLCCWSSLK